MSAISIKIGFLLFLCAFTCAVLSQEHGLRDAVQPGFQFRLSQGGLNYGAGVAVDLLRRRIPKIKIPDQKGSARIPIGKVNYEMTNIQIVSFAKPRTLMIVNPGNGLTWKLSDTRFVIKGRWRYKVRFIKGSGNFDVTVSSGNFLSVSFSLGMDRFGRPTISTSACSCQINSLKIRFHGGALSWFYNLFSSKVARPMKHNLQQRICAEARKIIDVNANVMLATLPLTIVQDFWMLDNRLILPPAFKPGYMETYHKGEFFLKNDTSEAPFKIFQFQTPETNQMITVWVSDYMLNTIGYVLYKGGILKVRVTKDDLPSEQRGLFNTTCSSEGPQCFGYLIPQAAKAFPNATVEFEIAASNFPTAYISNEGLYGNSSGVIICKARLSNRSLVPMFTLNVSVTATSTLSLSGTILKGNVTQLSFVIKMIESNIGELSVELLTLLLNTAANDIIIPELNKVGQKGIPFPRIKYVQFISTKLLMQDHCLRIETDFRYAPSTYLYFTRN